MKRIVILLAAVLVSAVPAAAADSDGDRAALLIDAGRLAVMMGQARDVLPLIKVSPRELTLDTPQQTRTIVFEALVTAVLLYNQVEYRACGSLVVGGDLCSGLFLPRWLDGKARDYSDAQLQDMTVQTSDRVMPLWTKLCGMAAKPASADPVCPME